MDTQDDNLRIVLTGGGTGGHITPILAVAHELKVQKPNLQTFYIGERGGKFNSLTDANPDIDKTHAISAGKFRRYHGESWLSRLFDVKTGFLNLRDAFRVLFGLVQAYRLLGKIKPDVVFLKGGFVGVPVGLAAAMRHIPIVTHDSDALPGLANRLISKWAAVHATALEAKYYNYPSGKVVPVGVLVEHTYQSVTPEVQAAYKKELGLSTGPVLLITGGSSGAVRINEAVVACIGQLLTANPTLQVVHQVGKGKTGVYKGYAHDRLLTLEFLQPMFRFTGAADLIVTRAGANAMAEFGVQGKACIVIPSAFLTGGHQLENAKIIEEQGTAVVLYEDKLYDSQHGLLPTIQELLDDKTKREELGKKLQAVTIIDAAKRLASVLLGTAKK